MGFVAGEQIAWDRWWSPQDAEIRVFGGVLPEPRDDIGRFLNRRLGQLKDFASSRALVLLGEAGAGKSRELEKEAARRESAGQYVARIALRKFLSANQVQEAVRDAVSGWHGAGSPGDLTLAFDGFDEPLFAVGNLADVLERELSRLGPERLRVLITSRRSAWPERLGTAFATWWPDAATASLVLAPLTERNIIQAAATELDDPKGFFDSLRAADVSMLAAFPMTLRLLLAARVEGKIPSQRSRLYEKGVQGLAAETDPGRVEQGRDDPPLAQRLAAARRLAAVGLLSGRPQVIRRSHPAQDRTALGLDEVADGRVSLDALQAVFGGALMAASGAGRGWTHRSVQEFLTAQQCQDLPLASVKHLLGDPAHPGRVMPPLAGVAAWLAEVRADVAGWLVAEDPSVLMRADLRALSDEERGRVAGAVLARLESAPSPDIRSGYAGLLHPGLAAQLAPMFAAGEPAWRQQEAALIVQATGLRALDGQLMDLIEHAVRGRGPEEYDERIQAASWVAHALQGAQGTRLLQRVARCAGDAAVPCPVRAGLLAVVWPAHEGMRWLLQTVAPEDLIPRSPMGRRVVAMLDRQVQAGQCTVEDLDAWAALLPPGAHSDPAVRRVVGRCAWNAVCTAVVGDEQWRAGLRLLDAQWAANRTLYGVGDGEVAALPAQRRQQLVKELVQQDRDRHRAAARMRKAGMLRVDDLQWWIDDLSEIGTAEVTDAPAFFALHALADTVDDENAARVVTTARAAAPKAPAWGGLAEAFSSVTRAARASLTAPDGESWDPGKDLAGMTFAELIRALHKAGRRTDGTGPVPGWPALSEDQQQNAATQALVFLCSDPDAADDVDADLIMYACLIITAVDRMLLDEVPASCWLQWLPGLWDALAGYDVHALVLGRAAEYDEAAAVDFLARKMSSDAGTVAFHQRWLKHREVSARALAYLHEGTYAAGALAALLDIAVSTLPAETAELAFDLLQRSASPDLQREDEGSWNVAVTAGSCLAACPLPPAAFDQLLHVMTRSTPLATDIIRQAHHNVPRAWEALTSSQRSRLFVWARQTFPPQLATPGRMVRSDPVDEFPSQLLPPLTQNPSAGNARVLDEIAAQTDSVWLRAEAAQMREAVRALSWRPPTAAEALTALTSPERRIIAADGQLAAVMAEALADIAADLRRDRGLRTQLWHRQRRANRWHQYVPLEEREVSTWLAHELAHRLRHRAAVLREVEINPRLADTAGDIPDLLALAHTAQGHELSVPGEVKCSWNREVITAIEDQLGRRYLTGPRGRAGVYVAVHFGGSAWDPDDKRRSQSAHHSPHRLREDLRHRAAELAAEGITAHVCVLDASLDIDEPNVPCPSPPGQGPQ
ncbi:hypothetical protein ACWDQL_30015 [Streptomyces olivaceus]